MLYLFDNFEKIRDGSFHIKENNNLDNKQDINSFIHIWFWGFGKTKILEATNVVQWQCNVVVVMNQLC